MPRPKLDVDPPPQPKTTANQLFNMRVASAREMLLKGFSQQQVIAIHGSIVLRYVLDTWNCEVDYDSKRE